MKTLRFYYSSNLFLVAFYFAEVSSQFNALHKAHNFLCVSCRVLKPSKKIIPEEENGMALSKTTVIGRLTKDPEVKTLTINGEETQVANFTVAVDEDFGDGTDFYDVVAWRQLATTVGKFMKKGRLVYVEGRSKTRTYPITKDGVEFTGRSTEIRASKVDFLDKAPTANQDTKPAETAQPAAQTTQNTGPAPF